MKMSIPPSRAHSDVFSASQYGGPPMSATVAPREYRINYFIIPIFVLEIIGLACLWALFYYLRFTDVFPYHQRFFHCNDSRLNYPNFAPSDFTMWVSENTLYCVSFIIPPLVIVIGEIMFWLFSTKPRKTVYANCREFKVHLITRRIVRFIAVFLFGALIVCIFIDSIKLITGYQRPYFLTLCRINQSYCQTSERIRATAPNSSPDKLPRIACTETNDNALRYAWLTFPSLYAGLSSFAAIFTSCYIHYMIRLRGAPLLRPFLIFGFLGMCLVASFSRINGYKNHWRDIWVAWLIGALTAIYLCHNVLCFQEVYRLVEEKGIIEERISPFFSWFKLPRVTARSIKDDTYSVYTNEEPAPAAPLRHRARDQNRTYEVTTTTESFQRTISPPNHLPQGITY